MPESHPSQTVPVPAHSVSLIQLAGMGIFIAGYALLSHYSNTVPGDKGLAAGLTLAPILLIGAAMLWQWANRLLASLVLVLACGLLVYYWPILTKYYEWADLAQQCGAYALLSLSFGRSLWGGRIPLCTQLAAKLHGPLTPVENTYTRGATLAWSLMYALLSVVILGLFFKVSLRLWSLFVNFVAFGLITLMFIVDHAIRHRVLPRRPARILGALRQSLTRGT